MSSTLYIDKLRVPKVARNGRVYPTSSSYTGLGTPIETSAEVAGDYMLKTGDNASGSYTFDTDTFVIDAVNHRVGIGNAAPSYLLDVDGDARFTGIARIGDDALITGRVVMGKEIIPSAGQGAGYGIIFPPNPGGGAGDSAFIQYYAVGGETTRFVIGTENDGVDSLVLYQYGADRLTIYGGNVGIGYSEPTRKLEVNGTSYFNDYIYAHTHVGSESFVSGFAGSGWKLEHTTGDATLTVDNLFVRKSMSIYELIINKIRATNGSVWVSDAAKIISLSYDPVNPYYDGIATMDTDNGNIPVPFVVGDILRCQHWNGRNIKYYVLEVTLADYDWFEYTVIAASNMGSVRPEPGDDVVRIGNISDTNRQGAIYLTASDSGAPYIDVLDGVVSDSFAGKTKVRLGKLNGITDATFGALSGYGLYSQNVYLTGAINATKATIKSTNTGKRIVIDGTNNNMTFYSNIGDTTYVKIDDSIFGSYPGIMINYGNSYASSLTPATFYIGKNDNSAYISAVLDGSAIPNGSLQLSLVGLPTKYLQGAPSWKLLYVEENSGIICREV